MSIDLRSCNEEQLWKYVGSHLAKNSIEAVLVGGAVVSIYSEGAYRSGDLDFIVTSLFKDKLPTVMAEIGFRKTGRHYTHPDCKHLFVEFPPGPLGIGDDYKIEPTEQTEVGTKIRILSPTDCIKDRLATYAHQNSRDGLDQAILVAKRQPFDIKEVERWCRSENVTSVFHEFVSLLGGTE